MVALPSTVSTCTDLAWSDDHAPPGQPLEESTTKRWRHALCGLSLRARVSLSERLDKLHRTKMRVPFQHLGRLMSGDTRNLDAAAVGASEKATSRLVPSGAGEGNRTLVV